MVADPLLGLVDTAWVGRLGTLELAAMGPNNTLFTTIIAVLASTSLCTAATRLVAQSLAARDPARTRGLVACVASATFAVGLLLAGLLLAFPEPLLRAVGCADVLLEPAGAYLRVRAFGVPFALLLVGLQGCYNAATDTVTPLVAILATGVLNGVLDPVLMFGLGWGVAGAAAATVAAQALAALALAWLVFAGRDRAVFGFGVRGGKEESSAAAPAAAAAVSPGVWARRVRGAGEALAAYLGETLTFMLRAVNVVAVWSLTSTAAARLGVVETAAHQLVLGLFVFLNNAMTSFSTIGTVAAARRLETEGAPGVRRVGNRLLGYAAVLSAAIGAAFYLCRGPMIAAFTSDPAVHFASTTAMVPTAAMAAGLWLKVPEGVLIGAGDGRFVSLAFIPAFAVTSVGLWATARWGLGLPGIWAALLAYYVVLIASFLYRWVARVGAGGWAPPSAPPEVGSG
jgi:MATE family multidrug resistance protein